MFIHEHMHALFIAYLFSVHYSVDISPSRIHFQNIIRLFNNYPEIN